MTKCNLCLECYDLDKINDKNICEKCLKTRTCNTCREIYENKLPMRRGYDNTEFYVCNICYNFVKKCKDCEILFDDLTCVRVSSQYTNICIQCANKRNNEINAQKSKRSALDALIYFFSPPNSPVPRRPSKQSE